MSNAVKEIGVTKSEMNAEELELLNVYRRAKQMGYADIAVTVQDGKRVKLWLTEKISA